MGSAVQPWSLEAPPRLLTSLRLAILPSRLDVLSELASPATVILLGFERRPGDGVERFFAQAAARGFRTTLRRRCQRVLVCELRLVG